MKKWEKEQRTFKKLRLKVKQLDSQRRQAQESLRSANFKLKSLKTFRSTKEGIFTPEMRELGRRLYSLGCSAENVGEAIKTCADAFGISVTKTPSRRSVLRFRDEGGFYGLIQLGREISHSERMGECSDGTTDRKTTYESHHVTYKCPTYLPDVDDSDSSTWTHRTRFVTVEPAVDHTGKTQFEGTQHLAAEIAAAYSDSPLAKGDGKTMSADDWIRKEEFQNMDHAADGKKKLEFCTKWKKEVLTEDLGNDLLDYLETGELHSRLASLSDEDLAKAKADATYFHLILVNSTILIFLNSSLSTSQADIDRETSRKLLTHALGEGALEVMPAALRDAMLAITFAGCCAHKDMNAFKYGVAALEEMWEKEGKTPPILLANKANASTIRLGDPDSAAVRAAETSSTRGGVKATMLAGALFNHSDDKKGYQDLHRRFMALNKLLLYDIVDNSRFADTSNTRFQSNTYGSAELITHLPLYHELMEEVTDGKVKPGFNHLESNLYKALHDIPTLTELAAITLYGVAISWPYLRTVRGDGTDAVRNILDDDLIELHRKIPAFCESIAENPNQLLQEPSSTNFSMVTLDGRPWMDPSAVMAIRILASELPELKSAISAIFSAAAKGWRQFTQEFISGGPFDLLTPEQRSELFIPATNDVNEGALGSWRVSRRSNPNITAAGFSNKTRYERNNTDRFIAKLCDDADHCYVRQEVRRIGASGENTRLQENLLEAQRKRAEANRLKKSEAARKKREELERLSQVGLIMDHDIIMRMTVVQLKDQIKIHKQILADPILGKTLQKDLKTKAVLQVAVLSAVEQNKE
ncbi:hypothetical protein CPB83DRAFT_766593 [Crepidotus variabilis]|uniref:Uncharacterized protein n=1 Tax=Crepidotus variabilis TaxID=179855 RepID=A0A9P6JPR4_9AGAR|nr:hypothetical protein CPB83DRAFT_766593 [Crepidotus variabilis]